MHANINAISVLIIGEKCRSTLAINIASVIVADVDVLKIRDVIVRPTVTSLGFEFIVSKSQLQRLFTSDILSVIIAAPLEATMVGFALRSPYFN